MRKMKRVQALLGILAVLVLVVSAAGCGLVSDQDKQDLKKVEAEGKQARQNVKKKAEAKGQQAKQQVKKEVEVSKEELKKEVETGKKDLEKKVDEVQKDVNDLQEKVDAQDRKNQ